MQETTDTRTDRVPGAMALLSALLSLQALRIPTGPRMTGNMAAPQMVPVAKYKEVVLPSPEEGPPRQAITVFNLMPHIHAALGESGLREGTVNLISRHTTCGITINEWESRLCRDMHTWLLKIAPPDDRSAIGNPSAGISYEHNDIDERPESGDEHQRCLDNGWDISDPDILRQWRDQE